MALKKEAITKIAKYLKLKETDLTAALADTNEVDVAIDDTLSTFSKTELETLESNKYNEGKKAGVEIEVKDIKEKLGLEFTGKTLNGLLDAATKKALEDAKLTPDKQVTELQEKVKTLQSTVTEQTKQLADKDAEVNGVRINSELYKHIPQFGENGPALSQDDVIGVMNRNGYVFKLEEGKMVAYKGDTKLVDKMANPLDVSEVVTSFLKEKKFITEDKVPGGRGGKDQKPAGKAGSLSEIKKQFAAQGKSELGQEFAEAVAAASKDNPDFKME